MKTAAFRKGKSLLSSLFVLVAIAAFLAFPSRYANSIWEGICIWAVGVLPATFPFLFLTALLRRQSVYPRLVGGLSPIAGTVFRVSGAGACAHVLSLLSGYPIGARTVYDLANDGQIGREEIFRLSALCTTSGPMFLVGTVGAGMFRSAKIGWILYASHLLSVWIVCFFLRFTGKKNFSRPTVKRETGTLFDTVSSSVLSVLCVGGTIALFYAFGQIASDFLSLFGTLPPIGDALVRGLIEMTTGCARLSGISSPFSVPLACAFVTFGGLCVIMQQYTYLAQTGAKLIPFIGVKLLQAALSFGICLLLCTVGGV